MPTESLTLTWTENGWQITPPTPEHAIVLGGRFDVAIPEDLFVPETDSGLSKLLLPKGTVVYLPISPAHEAEDLYQRCKFKKSKVTIKTDKDLLPITINDDLRIRVNTGKLFPCPCLIEGDRKIYPSLNSAAEAAILKWTNRQGAINAFKEVIFVEGKGYHVLHHKRREVLDGISLPESNSVNLGPTLPGMDED